MSTASQLAVEMTDITKGFNGVPVLRQVGFELEVGEVHALAGENGAGKSTLMKILQGVYQRDSGEVRVLGELAPLTDTFAARAAGIGMVFQEFSLVPTLTVWQNIFLTAEPMSKLGFIDDATARQKAKAIFADMGVSVDVSALLENLPTAIWQLTEIAKALAQNARVLIMDEPTASLAKHETNALFELIERLKSRGISIIYISHRMDEVYRVADRITVLRDGENALTARLSEVTPAQIVEAIVGRKMSGTLTYEDRGDQIGKDVVLSVSGLASGSRLANVSFDLHRGEILGLAGLMGSGRTELVNTLFGIDRASAGRVEIDGKVVNIRNAGQAIANGLALIPEDRRAQGLVLDHSVEENLTLPLLGGLKVGPLLSSSKIFARAKEMISTFSIKVADQKMPVTKLSGGNQQKVVIGKWLGTNPSILMMDEPTAGVDIGTKQEILAMVREIADQGKAVILISSELPELLSVSDRILVLRDGEVARNLSRSEIPSEEFLQLAVQGA
jgi:ribose transport system ATP-binding protein